VTSQFLVDTSAYARLANQAIADAMEPLIQGGQVALCAAVELELLYSARNEAELRQLRMDLRHRFEIIPTGQADFDRAIEVMQILSVAGQHRSVPIPDLVIGAVAERSGLIIIHYDQDFDRLAEVTGQPARWVVPHGSI